MGTSSTNGGLNGELERSSTAPWERGDEAGAAAAGARRGDGTRKVKGDKEGDKGRSAGKGSSDRMKVWMLLDRSGSMGGLEAAVVKGAARFLDEQAAEQGKCRVTVAQFDSQDPFEVLIDSAAASKADRHALERYQPRGTTPLFDAIGRLIGCADQRIALRAEAGKRPEDQTVVIVTDGLENASTDYSAADINKLISERREQGWAFVFLGANQDSYRESARMGFDQRSVQNYEASQVGLDEAFGSTSRAYSERRATFAAAQRVGIAPSSDELDDFFGGVREAEEGMSRRSTQGPSEGD